MKKYSNKLYVGVMLLITALILDAVSWVPAAGQLQIGHIIIIVIEALFLASGIVFIVLGARQKKREGSSEKRKLDKVQIAGIVIVCAAPVANVVLRDFVLASFGDGVAFVRNMVLYAALALGVAMIVYGTRCKLFSGKGR